MKQGLLKALTGPGLKALIGTFPCKTLLRIPRGGSVGVTYNYLKARKSTKVTCLIKELNQKRKTLRLVIRWLSVTKRNRMLLGRFALFTLQFVNIINITGN